jgi:DNA mismatch repair protein MutS
VDEDSAPAGDFCASRGLQARPPWHFDLEAGTRCCAAQFGVRTSPASAARGCPQAVAAAGCLLRYVLDTQRSALPHLRGLRTEQRDEALVMDAATRRNLELDRSLVGRSEHTLPACSTTPPRRWAGGCCDAGCNRPLRDARRARGAPRGDRRLLDGDPLRAARALRGLGDIERILARVALRSARPRDLPACATALGGCRRCARSAPAAPAAPAPRRAGGGAAASTATPGCCARAIVEEPPVLVRDGGVIAPGFDAELDELRALSTDADRFLAELEARERERTGIATLKVGYNRVHGYYIEISRARRRTRRPTTAGARRSRAPSATSRRN